MASSRKCPGIVIAAAILLLVFSGFKVIGACFTFASPMVNDAMGKALKGQPGAANPMDIQRELEKEVPSLFAVQMSAGGANLVLGLAGIISSIFLFFLKPSARIIAQSIALLNILVTLAENVYSLLFVIGPTARVTQQQLKGQGNANVNFGSAIAGVSLAVVGALTFFSLALYLSIFFMLRSKTSRDAFAGKSVPAAPNEGADDRGPSRFAGYEDDEEPPETDGPRS